MKSVALSFSFFLYWSVLGTAVLTALYSRRNLLRNLLLAPITGVCIVLLPVFWINRLGVPVGKFGFPLALGLLLAAVFLLWRCRRKPIVPWRRGAPFAVLLIVAFFLSGSPFLEFDSNWLSYGNNDMANYVLAAYRFHDFGYFDVPDTKTFAENRDATLHYWFMHVPDGSRSGSELAVTFAMTVTHTDGFVLFMPVIFALHLAMIAAAAGLILSSKKRRGAALLATALMAGCALITLGVVYQLIAQVFGMGLLSAGAAMILRPFPRLSWRRTLGEATVIAILLASLAITYPEIAPFLVLAFLVWHGLTLLRSHGSVKASLPVWILALVLMMVFLNSYLPDSVTFLREQSTADSRGASRTETLFPFYLIPSGLANLWSLLGIAQRNAPAELDVKIFVGFGLTLILGLLALQWTRRREPVAVVAAVMYGVGLVLFIRVSNFGLYKLAMFIQPFLAGTISLGILQRRRDWKVWGATAAVFWVSLNTQHFYVDRSRGAHGGLLEVPDASASRLLDEARTLSKMPANARVAGDTFNVVVAKIQAMNLRHHSLEFISRDFFPQYRYSHFFTRYVPQKRGVSDPVLGAIANRLAAARLGQYRMIPFDLKQQGIKENNEFLLNPNARELAVTEPQFMVASMPRQGFLNRRRFEGAEANFKVLPMNEVRNHLAFISSYLGQSYYMEDRRHAAFFQLEADLAFPGRTMSSTGRHILFQVLNPSPGGRLLFDYTATWNADHDNSLPPAEVVGDKRYRLPVHGRGAARVYSPPLMPQQIGGQDYLAIDMGRDGKPIDAPRHRLMNWYGRDILLDIRWITGFARDVSYVSEEEYEHLRPPTGVWKFPEGLLPRDLEYSGIYEDGWVSEDSTYTFTQTPDRPDLVVSGSIPAIRDQKLKTEAVLTIDGVEAVRQVLPLGEFELRAPVPYKDGKRAVELKFSSLQSLPEPDNRPVSAMLHSIGFEGLGLAPEDIITRGSPMTLSGGWYDGEKFNGQVFRWVNNDAVLSTHEQVDLDMEPGPGIEKLPAKIEVIASGGEVITKELGKREQLHLEKASTYRIHVLNGGRRIATDPRILNLRVFPIIPRNLRPEIALQGVELGKGWDDVETQNGRRFRWADNNPEFVVRTGGMVHVDVEPGPSMGNDKFLLKVVDANGQQVAAAPVQGREKVKLNLASNGSAGGGRYRFVVDSVRKPVPNDPRILNFRVWEMSLQSP